MTILQTEDGAPVRATNRLPVELYGPTGQPLFPTPRLAADNLAPPTAPDVLATLLGYDRAGGNLDLVSLDAAHNLLAGWRTADAKENDYTGSGGSSSAASADAVASGYARHLFEVLEKRFNGGTWEPARNNTEGTLLASAARTTTTVTAVQTNHSARGILLVLEVTGNPGGAETLILQLRTTNPVTGNPLTIYSSAALFTGASGIAAIELYPGLPDTAVASVSLAERKSIALPRSFDLAVLHSAAGSWTYSLGYRLIR